MGVGSGTRPRRPALIAGYLGKGDQFDEAVAEFAAAYAEQNEHDYQALLSAVRRDRINLYCEGDVPLLFTENETNNERLFGTPNASRYVKDGINSYVVQGNRNSVNPEKTGTKSAAHYQLIVGAGQTATIRLRLSDLAPAAMGEPFKSFAEIMQTRQREADEFYKSITPPRVSQDEALVMRQALAGMLWSKQFFFFDVDLWLKEHGVDPMKPGARLMRNSEWFHMVNQHIISMPDKWEYPWYAAWDLAFHTIALSTVDTDFAKEQLELDAAGVLPASDRSDPGLRWNFSDVNPPVHAWATIFLYRTEQALKGEGDIEFLAMNQTGPDGMWDEEDGFYYDVLRLPDGSARRLKVRSMVGLLPLCATTVIEPWQLERTPRALKSTQC